MSGESDWEHACMQMDNILNAFEQISDENLTDMSLLWLLKAQGKQMTRTEILYLSFIHNL